MEHSKSSMLFYVWFCFVCLPVYIERENHWDKTVDHEIDFILLKNDAKQKAYSLVPSEA